MMHTYTTGDHVRRRRYGWEGVVLGTAQPPYLRCMRQKLRVRFAVTGQTFVREVQADDLEPIAIPAPPARVFDVPPTGAVHDAVVDAVVARLKDERPGRPSSVPGLNVVDGGRIGR